MNPPIQELKASDPRGNRDFPYRFSMRTFFFDLVFLFFAIIASVKFSLRLKQAENSSQLLDERRGYLNASLKQRLHGQKVLWLHAVSVGEVLAAQPFIERFLKDREDWLIALSITTPTGFQAAKNLAHDRLVPFYAPFDLSWIVCRTFNAVQPKLLLLMETEIWPNLIEEASRRSIPIGIINGRISKRSFRSYKWIKPLLTPILKKISFCLVQTKKDLEHYRNLGMPDERVVETGNMKFDRAEKGQKERTPLIFWEAFLREKPLFIAGSTHWNEEEVILDVFLKLKKTFPNLRLILAPRHPEKVKKVESALIRKNISYALFTDQKITVGMSVLVVNQIGILSSLYAWADVVYVGGSLIKHGGQNPIEAAAQSKAVLHGPFVENFEDLYTTLDNAGGAILVQTADDLHRAAEALLTNAERCQASGKCAVDVVFSLKGAADRTLAEINQRLFPCTH